MLAVAEPLAPLEPQSVWLATTPKHTGAETATGPVTAVDPCPLVAPASPPAAQVVLFAATPAHTGAETATGLVAEPSRVPLVAVAPPGVPDPVCAGPEPLPAPQVVLFAATPAHTGAETATGPVTAGELPLLVAVAEPDDEQLV